VIYISLILLLSLSTNAENFYKNGLYKKALEEYKKFETAGISNPNLYLNIGNCYYRLGEYGKALVYYRKGWFLSPNDPNILHNLSLFTKNQENPNPFISIITRTIDRISLRKFAYLLILSFSLLIILISIKLIQLVRPIKMPISPLLFIISIIFIFSLIGFGVWWGRVQSKWVVILESSIAYSGPGEQFKELLKMDEAEEGKLIRKSDGWWLVQLSGGEGGWVDSTFVARVLQ
jgi:tetratricopeptide (TPR) repeat protein